MTSSYAMVVWIHWAGNFFVSYAWSKDNAALPNTSSKLPVNAAVIIVWQYLMHPVVRVSDVKWLPITWPGNHDSTEPCLKFVGSTAAGSTSIDFVPCYRTSRYMGEYWRIRCRPKWFNRRKFSWYSREIPLLLDLLLMHRVPLNVLMIQLLLMW